MPSQRGRLAGKRRREELETAFLRDEASARAA
jgi:hypothetical protein